MNESIPADQAILGIFARFYQQIEGMQTFDRETGTPLIGQNPKGDSMVAAALLTQTFFQLENRMEPGEETT